jgi:hypothetical protein
MDLFDMDEEEPCSLFPLTANIGNSFVDTSKLISYMSRDESNIGMGNFKSKKPQNLNPLFAMKSSSLNTHRVLANPIGTLSSSVPTPASIARMRWHSAALKVKKLADPWTEFNIDAYPAEHCIRHRYNAIKKIWVQDECIVKIEPKQFACGAMRACFRMYKQKRNF